jgi:hypothetical protein
MTRTVRAAVAVDDMERDGTAWTDVAARPRTIATAIADVPVPDLNRVARRLSRTNP